MTYTVDPLRSRSLADVGGADLIATVVIGDDGDEQLILARASALGDRSVQIEAARTPHEQDGPLNGWWSARVARVQPRCGRRTKAGPACRTPVAHPGDACAHHRNQNITTAERDMTR